MTPNDDYMRRLGIESGVGNWELEIGSWELEGRVGVETWMKCRTERWT
jgi:hypothetical protein